MYPCYSMTPSELTAIFSGEANHFSGFQNPRAGPLHLHDFHQQAVVGKVFVEDVQFGGDESMTIYFRDAQRIRVDKAHQDGIPWPYRVTGYGLFELHAKPISAQAVKMVESVVGKSGNTRAQVKEYLEKATAHAANGPVRHFRDMTQSQMKALLKKLGYSTPAEQDIQPVRKWATVPEDASKGWLKPASLASRVAKEVYAALYGAEKLSKLLGNHKGRFPVTTALAVDIKVEKHEIAYK